MRKALEARTQTALAAALRRNIHPESRRPKRRLWRLWRDYMIAAERSLAELRTTAIETGRLKHAAGGRTGCKERNR